MDTEEILKGGESTKSVIKFGNTVRRSQNPNSAFVHNLLRLLEEKNYQFSPRYIGIDAQDREILTYLEGDIPRGVTLNEALLTQAVRMIRLFHDATVGSDLAGGGEVVCHGDLAPWNFVLSKDKKAILGIIDFEDSSPGKRSEDLAYFLWTFLELGNPDVNNEVQYNRIKNLCAAYGFTNGRELTISLLSEQRKVLEYRSQQVAISTNSDMKKYQLDKVNRIFNEIKWVEANRTAIEKLVS